jgi:hypothetical protein
MGNLGSHYYGIMGSNSGTSGSIVAKKRDRETGMDGPIRCSSLTCEEELKFYNNPSGPKGKKWTVQDITSKGT